MKWCSADKRNANFNRLNRVVDQVCRSKLGPATVLRFSNDGRPEDDECIVPCFGYNHANADGKVKNVAYKPEHGVERHFCYNMLVQVPDGTDTHDLFGEYPLTIEASRTKHHGAKAVVYVCGIEALDTEKSPIHQCDKALGGGHASTYLFK